ncbi:MAG: hypothetical protein IT313_12260 [Anaerolineales bacterium]|nr:hypothetical protein [Anaerolineales bacterium]
MPTGSYQKINYSLRPSKSIERKMLAEAMQRMSYFGRLGSYRYVGFGSTYFSDFKLFHKLLGIKKMVSIEEDVINQDRFKFNRPFSCVRMEFGKSTSVLPKLSWREKNIVWLDYDGTLNNDVLNDISFCCTNLQSGSMLLVSVNAHPERVDNSISPELRPEKRLELLKQRVGEEKVPIDVVGANLSDWGTAEVSRRIILNEIEETLLQRNGSRKSPLVFKQLINFHYADGARMLTVGGVIFRDEQMDMFDMCAFDQIEFVRLDKKPYEIEPPNLTFREIHYIDRYLPNRISMLGLDGLPKDDVEKYAKLYRYFPTFSETEI